MIGDAFCDVVVDPERGGAGDPGAVLVFLGGLHVGARRPGALDPEQVVVGGRELALAPA